MRRVVLALLVLVSMSCNEIQPRRRSTAPLNASAEFPCERYGGTSVNAVPNEGRCIVPGNVPYDFSVVVHVPETSFYAPGQSFVLTSDRDPPDLTVTLTGRRAKLPAVGEITGAYTVANVPVAQRIFGSVFSRENAQQSIPIKAVYVPLGRDVNSPYDPGLPLDAIFTTSRRDDNADPPLTIAFVRPVPVGRWLRIFEPAPPWDATFPPFIEEVDVKRGGRQLDLVDINGSTLDFDDPIGESRKATATRAEGLEGWTMFLRDRTTGRRVSTLKTLCRNDSQVCAANPTPEFRDCCSSEGAAARGRLETLLGRTELRDIAEAVLAPPEGWIGVPTLVADELIGVEIRLPYPALRSPVALEGIVATSPEAGVSLGVASRLAFESVAITRPDGEPSTLLRYSASVSTDDRGRFATVVPPGKYRVTVQPLEGTGFATFRQEVQIEDKRPITLSPPRRTRVRGSALLSDGRPANNADVLAMAAPVTDASATALPTPRPARAKVGDDGTFELDLDQGSYVLTVVPEAGTGFPRVLSRVSIPANEADVGVIRIPPPTRLGLQIVDPTTLARPIPLANVRIFASAETSQGGGGGGLLEIGNGLTDSSGRVEILLAQRPR